MLQAKLSPPAVFPRAAGERRPRLSWRVQRYLGVEVLKTFLFVFAILELSYSLLVAIAAARQLNLELPLVLPVMGFAAAAMLKNSVPLSLLFAASLVYGRFTADREVMALKSVGVSYVQLLFPLVLIGAFFTASGYIVNGYVVPHMNHFKRDVSSLLKAQLRYLGEGWNRDFPFANWSVWILHHSGRELEGIFVSSREDSPKDEILSDEVARRLEPLANHYYCYAARGRLRFLDEEDPAGVRVGLHGKANRPASSTEGEDRDSILLELFDVDVFWRDAIVSKEQNFFMQRWHLDELAIPFDPAGRRKKYRHYKTLSNPELVGRSEELRALLGAERVAAKERRPREKELLKVTTEYHQRWAWMLACFLFPALAGLTALVLNSPNRLLAFFAASTLVPAVFYGTAVVGEMLGQSGVVPWLSVEGGNFVLALLLAGGCLLLERRLLR
jgi:lipopolysaccharide export LptBFGC system permease protein LptF